MKAKIIHHKDIVNTAQSTGWFKTLMTAVKPAGTLDTLKGKGQCAVFAPKDQAFANLPAGTVESFLWLPAK